uniref:Uncharacterized protein n=1 Tax=Panagrolaimus superbus TaxID=310955 RepID=A0A914YBL2_9BILA
MEEEMFGKESSDFADLYCNDLLNSPSFNFIDEDIAHNSIENTVESDSAPVLITFNDNANLEVFYDNNNDYILQPISGNSLDADWDMVEDNQNDNDSIFAPTTSLSIPAPVNVGGHSFSTSLPATPQSLASEPSPQTIRYRKQVKNCCKALKAWLIHEQPRDSQKARQIISQYSVEIKESLRMRTPRSGRPHISQGMFGDFGDLVSAKKI